VESIVVCYWQPDLERFPQALQAFFGKLGEGTVADAFQAMRENFPDHDPRLSRWAFGLYGNSALAGRDMVPLQIGSAQSATTIPKFGKADYRLKLAAGPDAGREVPIFSHTLAPGQRLVVGRAGLKRCQIEVRDSDLCPEAFALEWEGSDAYLVNLTGSPESVRVEGLPVYKRLHLKSGQSIRSGSSEFLFTMTGLPTPAISRPAHTAEAPGPARQAGRGMFELVVIDGVEQDQGRQYPIAETAVVVGREGDFTLHDPAVSRQHLIVSRRDGLHFVNHLEGGDLVLNGVPVLEESELRPGDRLVLSAATSLQFRDSKLEVTQ
jgi:hypothetical protein